MRNVIQNDSNADQSTAQVRKSQKHDANLQKNSIIYFQIGLILCLLGTFALFEMQFKTDNFVVERPDTDVELIEVAMNKVIEYKAEIPEPKKIQSKLIIDKIIEVETINSEPKLEELLTDPKPIFTDKPIEVSKALKVVELPEDDLSVDAVQFVPIYPGCEKYELNSERKKCLNEKIGKLVQNKFNTNIASDYGLFGVQKINVEFKVDKSGYITGIRTRAPHPMLEAEAQRIINKIPKMTPGKMGTTPVNVIYQLPIKFNTNN